MLKDFRGKTLGSLSLIGKKVFANRCCRCSTGYSMCPSGMPMPWNDFWSPPTMGQDIAAVVIEPVQGEAGAVVPPDDFLQRLREVCNQGTGSC